VLAENVNGVRVVQAFSRQAYNFSNFKDYVNRYFLETSLDAAKVASVFTPIVDVLGAIATALVVYLGGTFVLGESITPGVLIAFVLYIDRLFDPIRDLSRRFDTLQSTMAGGERILELLNTQSRFRMRRCPEMKPVPASPIRDVGSIITMMRRSSSMTSISCEPVKRSLWWGRRARARRPSSNC
jgi:ATP-binding cassette subfamily B protein/subfamily B ATP-binding cassette protein MsbA